MLLNSLYWAVFWYDSCSCLLQMFALSAHNGTIVTFIRNAFDVHVWCAGAARLTVQKSHVKLYNAELWAISQSAPLLKCCSTNYCSIEWKNGLFISCCQHIPVKWYVRHFCDCTKYSPVNRLARWNPSVAQCYISIITKPFIRFSEAERILGVDMTSSPRETYTNPIVVLNTMAEIATHSINIWL